MSLQDYQSVLVTGASSGIGAAVVRALAARGLRVHAVARRRERLQALAAETGCEAHVLDVRDTDALYRTLPTLGVDVAVNNAGLGRGFGPLFRAAPEDITTTVETNVSAAAHVLRAVVPGMHQRGHGHVVNLGSTAGLYPYAASVYSATKAAVHMLSRDLRIELQGSGVRVTEICPGRVSTEFYDAAVDDPEHRARFKNTGIHELAPEDVAGAVLYALDAPWHVSVNLIEIAPTEQVFGGARFVPAREG